MACPPLAFTCDDEDDETPWLLLASSQLLDAFVGAGCLPDAPGIDWGQDCSSDDLTICGCGLASSQSTCEECETIVTVEQNNCGGMTVVYEWFTSLGSCCCDCNELSGCVPDKTMTIEIEGNSPGGECEADLIDPCEDACEALCNPACEGGIPCLAECEGSPWYDECYEHPDCDDPPPHCDEGEPGECEIEIEPV